MKNRFLTYPIYLLLVILFLVSCIKDDNSIDYTLVNDLELLSFEAVNFKNVVINGSNITADYIFTGTTVNDLNWTVVPSLIFNELVGVTVSPSLDEEVDFSEPVTYTITDCEGNTKQYTITITTYISFKASFYNNNYNNSTNAFTATKIDATVDVYRDGTLIHNLILEADSNEPHRIQIPNESVDFDMVFKHDSAHIYVPANWSVNDLLESNIENASDKDFNILTDIGVVTQATTRQFSIIPSDTESIIGDYVTNITDAFIFVDEVDGKYKLDHSYRWAEVLLEDFNNCDLGLDFCAINRGHILLPVVVDPRQHENLTEDSWIDMSVYVFRFPPFSSLRKSNPFTGAFYDDSNYTTGMTKAMLKVMSGKKYYFYSADSSVSDTYFGLSTELVED